MADTFDSMRRRTARAESDAENRSRLAWSLNRVTSTGWGEFKIATRIAFDCSFIEPPFVAYGYSLDGEKLVDTRMPRAWGFVTDWDQNSKGDYIGCWVAVVVDTLGAQVTSTVVDDPGYTIEHDFTFSAVASKNIPTYLLKA